MTTMATEMGAIAPVGETGNKFVSPFGAPEAESAARCGGKGSRLAALTRAGFPVPEGFVVTVEAAREFARENGFDPASAQERVAAGRIPAPVAEAIHTALRGLGGHPVAVRSSALSEDGTEASFAGLYESILDVSGEDAVLESVAKVWASAHSERVRSYGHGAQGCGRMAVVVQRMVAAEAAGVAFTADPVSGDRETALVCAVRGLGESLVSGSSSADEWRVRAGKAIRTRDEGVLEAKDAMAVSALAARIAAREGAPQDVEWALAGGRLHLLQARPITALPDAIEWSVPWGGWVRNFRLGEWIGDPVTPAFESWLLTDLEASMHDRVFEITGFEMPKPAHLIVNGWYYYGMNMVSNEQGAGLRAIASIPRILYRMATQFRANAAISPPMARLGFDHAVREWRERLAPAYRAETSHAESEVAAADPARLIAIIDGLARVIGRNFASVIGVAGYAAKTEHPLIEFWNRNLKDAKGCWLDIVRRGDAAEPARHDVQGLDWFHPTLGELAVKASRPDAATRARVTGERDAVIAGARAALADRPKLLRKFDALVAEAHRALAVREEQARELTLAWPVLRAAMGRLGAHLAVRGILQEPGQIYFLLKAEIFAGLSAGSGNLAAKATERKALWERQRRLPAPLLVGKLPGFYAKLFKMIEDTLHGEAPAKENELRGHPGSPGTVTGRVRILAGPEETGRLAKGEILVARVTTPAWTPAFQVAAAIITDTGSIASHASIVAREYGLPAVVATGNATTRLREGQLVTVDGGRGVVRIHED